MQGWVLSGSSDRRPKEKPSAFAGRTCCNASCAGRKSRNSVIAAADVPAEKPCAECGEPMHRREDESPARWLGRRFGSRVCASRYSIRTANKARLDNPPTTRRRVVVVQELPQRRCAGKNCEKVLVRRPAEKSNKFRDRVCCSVACANSIRNPAKPATECSREGCNRPAAAKYCSRSCASLGRRKSTSSECSREGCDRPTFRKYCSTVCASLARRNPAGDARRADRQRSATGVKPARRRARPVVEALPPVQRPEDLIPDPAIIAMDRRRREALRMFDEGTTPHQVAQLLGVSVAQARRWDEGVA